MVSIVSAVRDLGRLRQIYVVLVRHGFGEVAQRLGLGGRGRSPQEQDQDASPEAEPHEALAEVERGEEERRRISLPERVRLVCMDLGPSFVKLGQIASTRPDVLPAEWIIELKKLQDSVNPLPSKEIKDAVEASLGASIDDVYESFEDKPLAAASIGQVHRAVLKHADGPQNVVVKVQRPGIPHDDRQRSRTSSRARETHRTHHPGIVAVPTIGPRRSIRSRDHE
jgi:ubiquinone biosynthesis protein